MKNKDSLSIEAGTLYEANKQLIKQTEKPLNHLELPKKQELLENFFEEKVREFAMMLCHERRDYTIFQLSTSTAEHFAAREALGCCTDRGQILSIEQTKDEQAIEIWLNIDDEPFCYYLFPYDQAVIKC